MTGFNSKRDAAADKLQEPVAFDAFLESQDFYELMQTYRHCQIDAHIPFEAVKDALRAAHTEAALAQPAQEPVACERCKQLEEQAYDLLGQLKVANLKWSVAHSWVGLTDEEIDDAAHYCVKSGQSVNAAIRAIEAKIKEKNK